MDIVAGFPEMFQLDGVCVLFRSALEIPHPSPSSPPQPQFHEYETQQDFSNDPMTKFLTDCAERLKDAGPPKIQLNRYDSIDSCEEEKLLWDLNELTLEELKKRFHETNPFLPDILREYFSQSNKASNNSKENALNFSNAVYEIDQDDFEINSSQYETLNGSETSYEECQGSCAIVGNNDYQYSAYCDSICSHENYQEMLLEYSCVSSD